MNNSILSCSNIVKDFILKKAPVTGKTLKTLRAVDNISLELFAGETLGIVGESGSGKSTIGEILGDLQFPSSGEVFFGDTNIRNLKDIEYKNYRRNVQFIFQDPKGSMNPNYRIKSILEEPLITLDIENDPAERLLKVKKICSSVGLEESVLYKYPMELSGGQCQRVAIARALITNPQIIICDEAVSALDVSVQAQILNLLKDLQHTFGTSYIFITHDIGVVNFMSDRIIVMYHGKIVEQGNTVDILNNPSEDYTKKLLSASFARRD